MVVYQFCSSVNEANLYLVIDENTKEALIVDMPEWCEGLTNAIKQYNLNIKGIFITHSHYDHTSGLNYLPEEYKSLQRFPAHSFLRNRDVNNSITVGKFVGKIILLPGHTDDSVGLYFPFPGIVFSGDALFAGSVGGTYGEINFKRQKEAIKKEVLSLPEDTIIFPGHGPITTVGIEKRYNPFLAQAD